MKRNKENSVEKIIVKYDDGTEKEISNLILGTVQMGVELGLFEE